MNLWGTLAPLIIGSAIVPIQIVITIMLLRTPGGIRTSASWLAGMTTVRLIQGVLFGLLFNSSTGMSQSPSSGPGIVVSTLLLVVAVIFLVGAFRQLFIRSDADDVPPKWMGMIASMTPGKAFLLGAGMMLIGAKFWVFTIGAIGAITDSHPGVPLGILLFVVFVALAEIIHIAVVVLDGVAPRSSTKVLDAAIGWLQIHNRVIMIVIGLVFGVWFLVKALIGLGVF